MKWIPQFICLVVFTAISSVTSAQNVAVESTHDAYVYKSTPTAKLGTEEVLLLKNSSTGSANRNIYLKFDVSAAIGSYEQVLIKLIKSKGEELNSIKAYSTATGWSESTITWNNAPAFIDAVGQGQDRIDDILYIDVTNYVKSEIANNKTTISIALDANEVIGAPFTAFAKETGDLTKTPKLGFYENQFLDIAKNIVLSKYISSDMIIQRGQPFPFKGTGPAGATINVEFVRENVAVNETGVVDADGNFTVSIPAMDFTTSACTATISIQGFPDKTVVLDNILIGDVWFAGGQSNMEKKVDYIMGGNELIAEADNFPMIRAFRAEYNAEALPQDKVKANNDSWIVCNTTQLENVSAVAYVYAKRLFLETGIPIGLMQAYVGGTEIETWISQEKIATDPKLQFVEDRLPSYGTTGNDYFQKFPSVNHNGMVNPLRFFPIKGFLFYQGESNVKRAPEYGVLLKSLIQDYRAKWNLGDLPFYYVQLFNIGIASDRNYEVTPDENTWQMVRQQQYFVLENSGLENIGMAVIIETNEERTNPDNNIKIHPRNKIPVGERLARISLKEQYGKELVAYSPLVESTWVEGNTVYVRMKNVADGLKLRDGSTTLTGFALGNASGNFFTATAVIAEPNLLSITSPQVSEPTSVAYGWSRDPLCTLDNSADLPASPFKMSLSPLTNYGAAGDSYIETGSMADVNNGTAQELKVSGGNPSQEVYLTFDTSELLLKSYASAVMKLYANTVSAASSVSLYTTDNTWTENSITSNNAPIVGQLQSTTDIDVPAVFYEWDVTDALKAAISSESLFFSVVLKSNNASSISFNSRESSTNGPQLILSEKEATLSADLIVMDTSSFMVFPNPVNSGSFTLRSIGSLEATNATLSLTNLLGQTFNTPSVIKDNDYVIDVSTLSSGTYILIIKSDAGKFHKKIVVQ